MSDIEQTSESQQNCVEINIMDMPIKLIYNSMGKRRLIISQDTKYQPINLTQTSKCRNNIRKGDKGDTLSHCIQ